MEAGNRFADGDYRNWLKANEVLQILRRRLRVFLENETETYHLSLRGELSGTLNGAACQDKCDGKAWGKAPKRVPDSCPVCCRWAKAILANHKTKTVHWRNCQPCLWPQLKWEVAKAFMPGGHEGHGKFEDFDIAALLNLMSNCTYFKKFVRPEPITKVIHVRNQLMHSPQLHVSDQNLQQYCSMVCTLAGLLEKHVEELKITDLSNEVDKFCDLLEKCFSEPLQSMRENYQTFLEAEQHLFKEKIESLIQRYESDQEGVEEELQGIRTFLQQNTDLQEKLGPQMELLQMRVDHHEQQITDLNERVDQLEKAEMLAPEDPEFSTKVRKYKNHLIEMMRSKKWKPPEFSEIPESDGYRGQVLVNGQSFKGKQVCARKVDAHQEVAKIALLHLKNLPEETGAACATADSHDFLFYGSVTVSLDTEVAEVVGHTQEEVTESIYKKVACQLGLNWTTDQTRSCHKTLVLEHFKQFGFPLPLEDCKDSDGKINCKLRLKGPFTFRDEAGATTKKQAEQQAAKVSLLALSGVLNCQIDPAENHKGALKECLDALGLKNPSYNSTQKGSSKCDFKKEIEQHTKYTSLDDASMASEPLDTPHQSTRDGNQPQHMAKESENVASEGARFYGCVKLVLNNEVASEHVQEDKATESAYSMLAICFGLDETKAASKAKERVWQHFQTSGFPLPLEERSKGPNGYLCRLKLSGAFSFKDKDGSTKKKQAEQQAAKAAFFQLSRLLKCKAVRDENYKGALKERLESCGLSAPIYEVEPFESDAQRDVPTLEEPKTCPPPEDSISSGSSQRITESSLAACSDGFVKDVLTPSLEKQAKMEFQDIEKMLLVFNLKPPTVTCDECTVKHKFTCTVTVQLDSYIIKGPGFYKSKKEASRKTFHLLAVAAGLCRPDADDTNSIKEVKQHFSQKSFHFPEERVEEKDKMFSVNLVVKCLIVYEEQGSTKEDAQQAAFKKAFSCLVTLFGTEAASNVPTENAEERLRQILKRCHQMEPTCSIKTEQFKASIKLEFINHVLESTVQKNKKENQRALSRRILGLLGLDLEASTSVSERNAVDEWFKKNRHKPPEFEDMDSGVGARVKFSVPVHCYHPAWKDSLIEAEESLKEELTMRLSRLNAQQVDIEKYSK